MISHGSQDPALLLVDSSRRYRRASLLLRVIIAIQLVGLSQFMIRFDGSSMAKAATKQIETRLLRDDAVSAQMQQRLFDDAPVSASDGPASGDDANQAAEGPRESEPSSISLAASDAERLSGVARAAIIRADRLAGYGLWLLAALILLYPTGGFLLFAAAGMLAVAGCSTWLGGKAFSSLSVASQAVRWASPIALLLLLPRAAWHVRWFWGVVSPREIPSWRGATGLWLLKLAAAATFAAHGYKAIMHHGAFVDLILNSADRFGVTLSETQATTALSVIGWMDVCLAVLVLFNLRFAALWMAAWGLLTASSRMTAMGLGAYHETLLRAANFGAPLVIYLYLTMLKAERQATAEGHVATGQSLNATSAAASNMPGSAMPSRPLLPE